MRGRRFVPRMRPAGLSDPLTGEILIPAAARVADDARAARWPLGAVFIASVETPPARLLGFGEWESVPFDRGLHAWKRTG